ncbi:hypothetical protein HRE53_30425 (plasmid) [Acaryochloris sp. 'Moss Beach']|uniref:hypothetical protein n=1 Tax=Acaryochloris sp. 'Moss Beach' TaxID=2740837 RepID=UPI001F255571|nr:hypothetical protein [Acaryochloris sp. 'Moss Beach']UJB72912.1 hypothetical protein HRE53_30425 [Acaryochloris sp. 'Moss Beach']
MSTLTHTEAPTTVNELLQLVDSQVTDPLHPEVIAIEMQIEQYPGVREGGDLFEVLAAVTNKPGRLGDRLRNWVQSEYGDDYRLADWRTIPTTRQLEAENDYEDEF